MIAFAKASLAMLMFLSVSSVASADPPKGYGLHFPTLLLNSGESIDQIDISVACGHIEAVIHIPNDWNVEIIRAISGVEELHASAGHGGSMLESIDEINGSVKVVIGEKSCFAVSAKFLIHKTGSEREAKLSQSELKLKP